MMQLRSSLRPALIVIAVTSAALAGVQWAWIADLDAPFGWLLESFGVIGFITVAAGLWLWDRRPSNRTGLLLVVAGLCEMAAGYGNTPNRFTTLVGQLMAEAAIAALAHLVLAFPSGQLRTRLDRRLVVAHYVVSIGMQVPMYVFAPTDPSSFPALQIAGHEQWVTRCNDLQGLLTGAILVVAAWIVWQRWRSAPIRSQRFALGVVYAYGIFVLLSFPLTSRLLRPQFDWSVYTLFEVQLTIIVGVPFVYVTAMLSGGLARTVEIGELARWMSLPDDVRPPLRRALAEALGDPSLQVLYRVNDDGPDPTYVDVDGTPATVPDGPDRSVSIVHGPTGERAAIVYDGRLLGEPELVDAAGSVVALAIDRERLQAELVASKSEVQQSRLRIVEQAELERRRLARDLHDGVQGRLVAAALRAGRLADGEPDPAEAARVRDEIDSAITELRHLVQGVMPALLVERGLVAAAEELVDRSPVPARLSVGAAPVSLSWPVASAAYFVVAEALANVAKHARASGVDVHLESFAGVLRLSVVDDGVGGAAMRGSGLRGLADRVAALDGTFHLSSEPGRGTRVEVELPCES
jgi:signal transduction histidine kinase